MGGGPALASLRAFPRVASLRDPLEGKLQIAKHLAIRKAALWRAPPRFSPFLASHDLAAEA